MTPEEHSQVVFFLAPWLVGSSLELLLQGILFSQFTHYYSWYRDRLGIRLLVLGILVLTTLKSIQSFALTWINLVEHFDDLQGALLLTSQLWLETANPLMVAVIGAYVQAYFCYRLFAISRRWWVVAPIVLILLFALLATVVVTYYLSQNIGPQISQWVVTSMSATFAGDTLMSLASVWFLLQSKKDVLPQTANVISSLIHLNFQSALPAAICAMLTMFFSLVPSGSKKLMSVAFNQMLPKLYAISMMWTLNARRSIRVIGSSNVVPSSSHGHSREYLQRTPFGRMTGPGDVELGTVQVQKDLEVVQHVDVRDM